MCYLTPGELFNRPARRNVSWRWRKSVDGLHHKGCDLIDEAVHRPRGEGASGGTGTGLLNRQKAKSTISRLGRLEPYNIKADNMTQYVPLGTTKCPQDGSTARIWRHPTRTGLVLKAPRTEPQDSSLIHKFRTEVGILKALDRHPRIVQ